MTMHEQPGEKDIYTERLMPAAITGCLSASLSGCRNPCRVNAPIFPRTPAYIFLITIAGLSIKDNGRPFLIEPAAMPPHNHQGLIMAVASMSWFYVVAVLFCSALAQICMKRATLWEIHDPHWYAYIVGSALSYLVSFACYYMALRVFSISRISPVMTDRRRADRGNLRIL
jgi:drug/metabolite transporter (DMT)-like permease